MNETEFWQLIEKTKFQSAGDGKKQAELLVEYLSQLSEGEILDFDSIFVELYDSAYNINLWESAIIIEGICTEDGFTDFRSGLIGRGQAIYEAALANPESLVDVLEAGEEISVGHLQYAAQKAYQLRTGEQFIPSKKRIRKVLEGEWTNEKDLPTKFPKLYAKFTPYWDDPSNC